MEYSDQNMGLYDEVAFRTFDHMMDPVYQTYKYGFPPGIYGSAVIPIVMWYHLWCENTKSAHYYSKSLLDMLFPNRAVFEEAKCFPVPVIGGGCQPFRSIDQMSVIYIYHVCNLFKKEDPSQLYLKQLCPNPCRRRPCQLIENAISGTCEGFGLGQNDFNCTCEAGFVWDNSTLTCAIEDSCEQFCNRTNTLGCYVNRKASIAICYCKDGFMGFDCGQTFDACVAGRGPDARNLGVDDEIPSGYDACGTLVDSRNLCLLTPNASSYYCMCSPVFQREVNLPYDNCRKAVDNCDKQICINGECVTSADGLESNCTCSEGYTGPLCEHPTGSWSTWSHWTQCEPLCGPARHRRRLRLCMSDVETDCIGPVEELRRCADTLVCARDADVEEETWLEFKDWSLLFMKYTIIYVGIVAILGAFLGICKCCKASPLRMLRRTARKDPLKSRRNPQSLPSPSVRQMKKTPSSIRDDDAKAPPLNVCVCSELNDE